MDPNAQPRRRKGSLELGLLVFDPDTMHYIAFGNPTNDLMPASSSLSKVSLQRCAG